MFLYDNYCIDGEEWRDIPSYEGLYQASSLGRIRSVDRLQTFSNISKVRSLQGKVLKNKTKIPSNSGYMVSLWKDKKSKEFLVARLVCMTFHGAVEPNMTVNHKDGNRLNNRIENLEWLTRKDNIRHGFENELYANVRKSITLINSKGSRFTFKSYSEASKWLGKNNKYVSGQVKRTQNIISSTNEMYTVLNVDTLQKR